MELLRGYILRLVTAAMISGLVMAMTQNGSFASVIRLVCGVFLGAVVLQPLSGGIPEISLNWTENTTHKGTELASEGSQAAQSAMADIIMEELEAYILDKAADLDAVVAADITLGEELLPVAVTIRGTVSAFAKEKLEQLLEEELGIPKENQTWTG